jgi:hypothetical protein
MTHDDKPAFLLPTNRVRHGVLQSCTTKQKTEGSEMTSNDHAVIQWWTEAHYGDRSRAFNFVGGHTSGAIWSSNTIANCCNCNQPPLLTVPIVELAWQPFVIRTSVLYMSAPVHVTTKSTRWIYSYTGNGRKIFNAPFWSGSAYFQYCVDSRMREAQFRL